ncbi:MAG: hypothetical protein LBE91_21785 [Tannerella sp.]|jgi:hypothetical protein|nr:hypothetical protein [Tannerella sp.]
MTRFLFTSIFTVTIFLSASAQKPSKEHQASVKEAINYARGIAEVMYVTNPEAPYFIYSGYGISIGLEPRVATVDTHGNLHTDLLSLVYLSGAISGGLTTLIVPKTGTIVEKIFSNVKYDIEELTYNFEKGKCYSVSSLVDYNNRINFSITEIDISDYTFYQDEYPNLLDGTWEGIGKRTMREYFHYFVIDGNTMKYEGQNGVLTIEGKLAYNENTIIFLPEHAYDKGREIKNFNHRKDRQAYIWYYELIDNELYLEGGTPFVVSNKIIGTNGVFNKIAD